MQLCKQRLVGKLVTACASALVALVTLKAAQAETLNVLATFNVPHGKYPYGYLTFDQGGTIWGTASGGGKYAGGTVFSYRSGGPFEVVYDFGKNAAKGVAPTSGLVFYQGDMYGTTTGGGVTTCYNGCGTFFKMTPDGRETVVYSFQGGTDDVYSPSQAVILVGGTFYGTSGYGGNPNCSETGCGAVYEFSTNGSEKFVYSFQGANDGFQPFAALVADFQDNVYGETYQGGQYGYGTVYEIASDSSYHLVYAFGTAGSDDGKFAAAQMMFDSTYLWGTTLQGGASNSGTIFRVKPDGSDYSIFYSFTGGLDGGSPEATVVQDANRNLFGSTSIGGKFACGTYFEFPYDKKKQTWGNEKTLVDLNCKNASGGGYVLLQGADDIFSDSGGGGKNDWGTLFEIPHADR